MAAHQAPPSLGFSRQEHWSGLPVPPPMHESETWKWSHSVVSDSATPWTAAYQAPLSMGFSREEYWSGVSLSSLIVKHTYIIYFVCAQSCPIFCNPMDCSLPVSSVHGIFQARILEQIAISLTRGSSWSRNQTCVSCICRQIFYHCAT